MLLRYLLFWILKLDREKENIFVRFFYIYKTFFNLNSVLLDTVNDEISIFYEFNVIFILLIFLNRKYVFFFRI